MSCHSIHWAVEQCVYWFVEGTEDFHCWQGGHVGHRFCTMVMVIYVIPMDPILCCLSLSLTTWTEVMEATNISQETKIWTTSYKESNFCLTNSFFWAYSSNHRTFIIDHVKVKSLEREREVDESRRESLPCIDWSNYVVAFVGGFLMTHPQHNNFSYSQRQL